MSVSPHHRSSSNPFRSRSDRSNYPQEFAQAFEGHGDVALIPPSPSAALTPPPMAAQQQQQQRGGGGTSNVHQQHHHQQNHHQGQSPSPHSASYIPGASPIYQSVQRSQSRTTATTNTILVTTADISSGSDCGSSDQEDASGAGGSSSAVNNNRSQNRRETSSNNFSAASSSSTQIQNSGVAAEQQNTVVGETPPPSPIEKQEDFHQQWSPASNKVTPAASPSRRQQQQQQLHHEETPTGHETFNIGALSPVTAGASPQAAAPISTHQQHHQQHHQPAAVDVRAEEARHLLLFSPRKQQHSSSPGKASSSSAAASPQPKQQQQPHHHEPTMTDPGQQQQHHGHFHIQQPSPTTAEQQQQQAVPIVGEADEIWEEERAKSQSFRADNLRHRDRVKNVLSRLEAVLMADENGAAGDGNFDGQTVVDALRSLWQGEKANNNAGAPSSSSTAYLDRFSSFDKAASGDFCYYSPHLDSCDSSSVFMTPSSIRSGSGSAFNSPSSAFARHYPRSNPYASASAVFSPSRHQPLASSYRAAASAVDSSIRGVGDRRAGAFGGVDVSRPQSAVFDILSPQTNAYSPRPVGGNNSYQQQSRHSPGNSYFVGGTSDPQRIDSFFSRSAVRTAEFVFS